MNFQTDHMSLSGDPMYVCSSLTGDAAVVKKAEDFILLDGIVTIQMIMIDTYFSYDSVLKIIQ